MQWTQQEKRESPEAYVRQVLPLILGSITPDERHSFHVN
jgi:hypothetical protein